MVLALQQSALSGAEEPPPPYTPGYYDPTTGLPYQAAPGGGDCWAGSSVRQRVAPSCPSGPPLVRGVPQPATAGAAVYAVAATAPAPRRGARDVTVALASLGGVARGRGAPCWSHGRSADRMTLLVVRHRTTGRAFDSTATRPLRPWRPASA
ncbi:hypothetical protein HPB52_004814 [Rhipicephalus sanguineus]|uniref:Uncharacterized protein n=1 Tax=Rhipicephalus sanguineus TaxID=34632 RepID=A0A9D4PCA6_RHISA|nr:hypothetical protein HPB52_004814 [Rhipicephalus sanguineus]